MWFAECCVCNWYSENCETEAQAKARGEQHLKDEPSHEYIIEGD